MVHPKTDAETVERVLIDAPRQSEFKKTLPTQIVALYFGTRPSHAAESRPLWKASPVPMAATIALEMIGPTPGALRRQCGS